LRNRLITGFSRACCRHNDRGQAPFEKIGIGVRSRLLMASRRLENRDVESGQGESPMNIAPVIEPIVASTQELERLGDQIAELSAHLDAATARLLDLIREFDARGGWGNGFSSCGAWLTWRVGLDPGAARERVRVARALGTLPRLAQALARGELSYSKVRALTRVATPETEERLLAVGLRAPRSTLSGSSAGGGGWIASPRRERAIGATAAARCMCIKTKTVWWSSAGGSSRRRAPS